MAGPSHGGLPAQEHARDAEGPYPGFPGLGHRISSRTSRDAPADGGYPPLGGRHVHRLVLEALKRPHGGPVRPTPAPKIRTRPSSFPGGPLRNASILKACTPGKYEAKGAETQALQALEDGQRSHGPPSPTSLGWNALPPVLNRQGTDPAQRCCPQWQALLRDRNSALAMPRPSIANAPSPLRVRPYEVTRIAVACRGRGPVLSTHA
ncbi:hypothetical protein HMPREF9701_02140 [Delftia acidovorans CCUG 274B]|uniref:Uncharacterized protein n=1 Tax=Delftia lacustris TaxID=558537 RepID=A0A1H3SI41_9BURK|nr:hypothetical protein HMPREF9701_02140 [Delftia acidovorans CCUG 274B]SDZ37201.1 hypothetical protein SAMN05421547_12045 [Delftia lacustris]